MNPARKAPKAEIKTNERLFQILDGLALDAHRKGDTRGESRYLDARHEIGRNLDEIAPELSADLWKNRVHSIPSTGRKVA